MSLLVNAADQPPADRVEFWRGALSQTFVPLEPTPGEGPLRGRLRAADLGGVQLAEVTGSAQRVQRNRAMIRRADPEYCKIGLQLRGRGLVVQDDREAVLHPGDLTVYHTSRPYRLAFAEDFQMLVLMCPRASLPVPERVLTRMTAVTVSGRDGVGALVAPFLVGLAGHLAAGPGLASPALSPSAASHLGNAVLDMLAAAVTADEPDPATGAELLADQVRRYIDSHLPDVGLNPESIARAHHISTRYLHKLFERDEETVAGWIRSRRLEHCRRDLAAQPLDRPVSAIAASWGLPDAAHFSKAFRAAYGLPPRDYRRHLHPT